MEVLLLIILLVTGSLAGALFATTGYASSLLIILTTLIFLPVLGIDQANIFVTIIATAISSSAPVLLVDWLRNMKSHTTNVTYMIALAPGAAMGGVIGAQIVTFMPQVVFLLAFSVAVIAIIIDFVLDLKIKDFEPPNLASDLKSNALRIPLGMCLGCFGIVSGESGKAFTQILLSKFKLSMASRQATASSLMFFASIAALVGFVFPAKELPYMQGSLYVGAINVAAFVVLALSQLIFFWMCKDKGNRLDKNVLKVGFIIFIFIGLVRLWL